MDDQVQTSQGWRLDKRIPLSLLIGMGIQALLIGFWAVHLEDRLAGVEKEKVSQLDFIQLKDQLNATMTSMIDIRSNIAEVKSDVKEVKTDVNRLTLRGK